MPDLNTRWPRSHQLFVAPVLQQNSVANLFLLSALHSNLSWVYPDTDSPECIQFFDTLKTNYANNFEWKTLFDIHFPNKILTVNQETDIRKRFIEEYVEEVDFFSSEQPFIAIECFFCVKQNLTQSLLSIVKECRAVIDYKNENGHTLLQAALLRRQFYLVDTLLNSNELPENLQNNLKKQISSTSVLYSKNRAFRAAVRNFRVYCEWPSNDSSREFYQIDAELDHLLSQPDLNEERIKQLTILQKEIIESKIKPKISLKEEALAKRKEQLAEREKWRKEQDSLWRKDYRSPTLAESIYVFFRPLIASILSPITSLLSPNTNDENTDSKPNKFN